MVRKDNVIEAEFVVLGERPDAAELGVMARIFPAIAAIAAFAFVLSVCERVWPKEAHPIVRCAADQVPVVAPSGRVVACD